MDKPKPREMPMSTPRKLVPDEHGRITLGDLARGVSSFEVTEEDGVITLRPMVEVPRSALWRRVDELLDGIGLFHGAPPTPRLRAAMGQRSRLEETCVRAPPID